MRIIPETPEDLKLLSQEIIKAYASVAITKMVMEKKETEEITLEAEGEAETNDGRPVDFKANLIMTVTLSTP